MRVATSKDVAISKDMDKKEVTAADEITTDSDGRDAIEATYENILRLRALHRLMRGAEDRDADALVDVIHNEQSHARTENHGVPSLKRILVSAVAVTLKSA